MGANKTTRDWSLLPDDILCQVFLKTDTIQDFVCFSIICRSWSRAFSIIKSKWRSKFPLLLLAENTNNNDDHLRKIFSLDRKTCWELKFPQASGARCWGSYSGWIVMFHLDRQISLFNPFSQAQVFLPSQSTMPNQYTEAYISVFRAPYNEVITNMYFNKIVVWKMEDDETLVVAIRLGVNYEAIAVARPGDKAWTYVITAKDKLVFDIVCRGDKMFLLYSDGALGYYTMSRAHTHQPLKALDYWPTSHCIHSNAFKAMYVLYLVDLLGDLLMVARYKFGYRCQESPHKTINFEVFKFNFETKEWGLVEDLGEYALFVGNNCSMCVRGSRFDNIKRNCIYFTDDFYLEWKINSSHGNSPDLGVFNMETKEIDTFYQGDHINSTFCPPLWFMPSFSTDTGPRTTAMFPK